MRKKAKKYSRSKVAKTKANEPNVAYHLPLLNVLNSMSFNDIYDARLSGETLVDIQEQTSLSAQSIASVIGVSKSKFYDLIKLDKLGTKNIDALADFAALWQKGLDAFDGNTSFLNEWLDTRNSNLGNCKPVELLSTRVGRRELERAFLRIEYSTYG